jgi:hypothetical protein
LWGNENAARSLSGWAARLASACAIRATRGASRCRTG